MGFDPAQLYWLLLPVVVVPAWFYVRSAQIKRSRIRQIKRITDSYYRGLHYLLQEQTDQAIEVLSEALENDSEIVEIHLALGHLFRQRGEADRAIHLYQNLIARPTLSFEQRNHALQELGVSYSQAGLFDRAEQLFGQVSAKSAAYGPGLARWLEICEQQHDWEKSVEVAELIERRDRVSKGSEIAHYLCEAATAKLVAGDVVTAGQLLKKALRADRDSLRANLMRAEQLLAAGRTSSARRIVKRLAEQQPAMLPELLDFLIRCYLEVDDQAGLITLLQDVFTRHPSAELLACIVQQMSLSDDVAATDYLLARAASVPTLLTLDALLSLNSDRVSQSQARQIQALGSTMTTGLLAVRDAYHCSRCGFHGLELHWCCPGCGQWGAMLPGNNDGETK